MKRPIITLLTDFGSQDHYVAAMKGVILGICPDANIVDITHEIPPFQIAAAAYTLAQAAPLFPKGTIHVAVVDPGVGGCRRPIAARASGYTFIGPDNGVLAMLLDPALADVREITNQRLFRTPLSNTFHGRDIFSPVAASLANGLPFSRVGARFPGWKRSPFGAPAPSGPGEWTGAVLAVDRFGNIVTNFPAADFPQLPATPFFVQVGPIRVVSFAYNYEAIEGSEPTLLPGSAGYLEVCVREGDAALGMGIRSGNPVTLSLL